MTNKSIQIDISTNVRGVGEVNNLTRELGNLEKKTEAIEKKSGAFAGVQRSLADVFRQSLGDKLPRELSFLEEKLDAIPLKSAAVAGAIGIASGALVTFGAAAFNAAKNVADIAIAYDKLSQQTGAGVEFLSLMTAVSNDFSVSTETFNAAMIRFSAKLKETAGGGADVQAELLKVADAFAAMKDGPEKTALAIELFGRAGTELIPVLNSGSKGLRELMEATREMGKVVDDDMVAAAKRFDDASDKLNTRLDGLKMRIGNVLLPVISDMVVAIDDAITNQVRFAKSVHDADVALLKTIQSGTISKDTFNALSVYAGIATEKMLAIAPGAKVAMDALGGIQDVAGRLADAFNQRVIPAIRDAVSRLRSLFDITPLIEKVKGALPFGPAAGGSSQQPKAAGVIESIGDAAKKLGGNVSATINDAANSLKSLFGIKPPADQISNALNATSQSSKSASESLAHVEKHVAFLKKNEDIKPKVNAQVIGADRLRDVRSLQDALRDKTVTYTIEVAYTSGKPPNVPKPEDFAPPAPSPKPAPKPAQKPPVQVNIDIQRVASDIDVTQLAWRVAEEIRRRA